MSSDTDTIRFGYESSKNITFRGEVETDITRDQWEAMSQKERDEAMNEAIWDLVQLWVVDE